MGFLHQQRSCDDLGRTTGKTRASLSATYTWGYGDFLIAVDSDFPDEGDVDYAYGGDMRRRSRDDGTNFTWYNWIGGTVANEEAQGSGVGDGTLTKTYIGRLGEIASANPSTGDPAYYMMDHLGSVRSAYDANDTLIGATEFTPFGNVLNHSDSFDFAPRFTVHHLDPQSGLYFAPFRYMDPNTGRWLKNDPLWFVDGTNMYAYAGLGPVNSIDFDGRDWYGPNDWWRDVKDGVDAIPWACEQILDWPGTGPLLTVGGVALGAAAVAASSPFWTAGLGLAAGVALIGGVVVTINSWDDSLDGGLESGQNVIEPHIDNILDNSEPDD